MCCVELVRRGEVRGPGHQSVSHTLELARSGGGGGGAAVRQGWDHPVAPLIVLQLRSSFRTRRQQHH